MDPNTTNREKRVLFPELSYQVTGLLFKVHKALGRFRSERSYADALESAFKENRILYKRELALDISFDGESPRRNIVDFIVEDKVIIELKAKQFVSQGEYAQMRRYLAAAKKELGLIVNFRQRFLVPKRVLNVIE